MGQCVTAAEPKPKPDCCELCWLLGSSRGVLLEREGRKEGEKRKASGSSERAAPWATTQLCLTAFPPPTRETSQIRHRGIKALPFRQGRFLKRNSNFPPSPPSAGPIRCVRCISSSLQPALQPQSDRCIWNSPTSSPAFFQRMPCVDSANQSAQQEGGKAAGN